MDDKTKYDGGPAFPVFGGSISINDGMSLRDYFAGQETTVPRCLIHDATGIGIERGAALEFLGLGIEESEGLTNGQLAAAGLAKWRFQCADAMLEARKGQ